MATQKKIVNKIGCPLLDEKGIPAGSLNKGREICLNCPYPECILKSKETKKPKTPEIKEVYVICKHCGASETLTLRNGKLVKTRRWQQRGDRIFHQIDCGVSK